MFLACLLAGPGDGDAVWVLFLFPLLLFRGEIRFLRAAEVLDGEVSCTAAILPVLRVSESDSGAWFDFDFIPLQ